MWPTPANSEEVSAVPEQEKKKKRPYVRKKSAAFGVDSVSFTQENGTKVEIGLTFDVDEAATDWAPAEYASVCVSGQYVVKWVLE